MKNNNVYIVLNHFYNSADEDTIRISGVFDNIEKARKYREQKVIEYMHDCFAEYIIDKETSDYYDKELVRLFSFSQENWDDYVEISIVEKVVE